MCQLCELGQSIMTLLQILGHYFYKKKTNMAVSHCLISEAHKPVPRPLQPSFMTDLITFFIYLGTNAFLRI